jgi:hypothetical protein
MKDWELSFKSRKDLSRYGSNGIGLFALQLRFSIDDIDTVAAESITDGNDDKKCDIININTGDNYCVIAQCYFSSKTSPSAPSNKASDLNTGVAWLLQRPISELPARLRSPAEELRNAINDNLITDIHVWYVHNLPESKNVKQELLTVESTVDSILKRHFSGKRIKITSLEVGQRQFDEWYRDTLSPIAVTDTINIPIQFGYKVNSDSWKAYVTSIPAKILHSLFRKHKSKLFSANVREYLGSRKSDANINYGIKKSAEVEPGNFWVYNNGLTILTNSFNVRKSRKDGADTIVLKGISIVNGAQTTGAIGSLKTAPDIQALVPVRFVQTKNDEIVYNIIQFNNSQNKVTASDFRSRDGIQKRLREEMLKIPEAEYLGGRRGGHLDIIQRNPKMLPSYTVGQALAAFHNDTIVAYNQKTNIWISDRLYSKFFNEDTTATHIVFTYSLLRAIEARKMHLVAKSKEPTKLGLTAIEQRELEYFRNRGSTYLLVSAIAGCIESIIKKRIPNSYKLSFSLKCSPQIAQSYWAPIIEAVVPFSTHLSDAFTDGLKSNERVQKVITTFQGLVESTAESNRKKYNVFSAKVTTRNQ